MIVVAIIALLAAIAIPNIVRARLNANEGAAMSAVRTVYTAAESFRAVQTPSTYPATLDALADVALSNPTYIPATFNEAAAGGGATVQGYVYTLVGTANTICLTAYPAAYHTTGNRTFGLVEDGVLRAADQLAQQAAAPAHATVAAWGPVSGM